MERYRVSKTIALNSLVGIAAITNSLSSLAASAASENVSSTAQTRSSTIITPATGKNAAAVTPAPHHAGATVMDDSDATDDADANKSKEKDVPELNYQELPTTKALCEQAIAYNKQRSYPQAVATLTSAITKDPRTILARRLYAQTTILNGEPSRAVGVLITLSKYTKPSFYDKCLLGSAFFASSNGPAAAAAFKDATAISPDSFYAAEGYIKSLILAQDFKLAASECSLAAAKFRLPADQESIKKLYGQLRTEQAAAQTKRIPAGDTRLSPPIPVQELTPFLMGGYGG